MNVGVYIGGELPDKESGGGFTLPSSILNQLDILARSNQYILFHNKSFFRNFSENGKLKHVCIGKYKSQKNYFFLKRVFLKLVRFFWEERVRRKYKSLLNRAVLLNEIDVMLFISPSYEYVSIPFIYTVWDLQHRRQPYFPEVSVSGSTFDERENYYNNIIPKASYVITGNSVAKQEVIQFYRIPEERVKILEFPTPDFALSAKQKQSKILEEKLVQKPYLFYPAQFWPHKNHIIILKAIKILLEKNYKLSVVFVGSDKGNLSYIKEQVNILKLNENIFFLGFVSQQDLIFLYQHAYALVFTSFFGPNNLPPLEAFATGCPVISSNAAGMEEQLGESALFFHPTNELELVEKIIRLFEEKNLREYLIAKGLKRARLWTTKDYVNGIEKIINDFKNIRSCWSRKDIYKHL